MWICVHDVNILVLQLYNPIICKLCCHKMLRNTNCICICKSACLACAELLLWTVNILHCACWTASAHSDAFIITVMFTLLPCFVPGFYMLSQYTRAGTLNLIHLLGSAATLTMIVFLFIQLWDFKPDRVSLKTDAEELLASAQMQG